MATRARENARERRLEEEEDEEEEENEGTSSRLAVVVACRDDAEEAEGKKEGEASKIGGTASLPIHGDPPRFLYGQLGGERTTFLASHGMAHEARSRALNPRVQTEGMARNVSAESGREQQERRKIRASIGE